MAGKEKDSDYFRLPNLFWMALVIFGIYLMVCCLHKPEWVPYDYLGPVGALARFLASEHPDIVNGLIVFAVVSHTLEAFYAVILCRNMGSSSATQLKWFLSTICFGMSSLSHLWTHSKSSQHTD